MQSLNERSYNRDFKSERIATANKNMKFFSKKAKSQILLIKSTWNIVENKVRNHGTAYKFGKNYISDKWRDKFGSRNVINHFKINICSSRLLTSFLLPRKLAKYLFMTSVRIVKASGLCQSTTSRMTKDIAS